ncbi:hypothetical protein ISG33_14565 [Glaciecola sp. MH2013]|uniref:hypothetical protein n=1 Tax=Glaciecola sp. MH2013 TaxID=2785524 RepID=UPI00189C95AE|nr:hypothetical protein [Glaciecola sp. MH2013]MBF7074626.1 hypothetical protein [Glaciecola sp. MH2013]
MVKALPFLVIFAFLTGCSHGYNGPDQTIVNKFEVSQDQMLLVVKVKDVAYTEYSTTSCPDNDCIVMRTWFVYEADVLEVLHGKYDDSKISFANMQHSYYVDEYTNEWYLLLQQFEDLSSVEKLNTKYYVIQQESKFNGS